ncbi:MAG: hypothetical protein PHQ28_00730 [Mycobacterium sp.]|nr:hypothetical protein [Mycobacterium sp.]
MTTAIDIHAVPDAHKSLELVSGWYRSPTGLYVSPLAVSKHRMRGEPPAQFTYQPWRHGGWYVAETLWPDGGCGCVSREFADRQWRFVCDPRPFDQQQTFRTRDDAARGEWLFVRELAENTPW